MRFLQRLALMFIRLKFKFIAAVSKKKAAEEAFRLFRKPRQRYIKELTPLFKKAEKLEFLLESTIIRGYRWNHPSENKLLILHGFESSSLNFSHFIKPLTDKKFEIIAFDAPGHGISDGNFIDIPLYQKLVLRICEKYGPVTSFIAHSFGGLALSLALESMYHNDSFKIVLIAPATETSTAINNYFRFLRLNGNIRPYFEKIILENGGKPSEWYSIARIAPSLKAQVLFLQDSGDELTPYSDVLPIINKRLPNFKFLLSSGLGHRKIYRDENSIKAIMDFLIKDNKVI